MRGISILLAAFLLVLGLVGCSDESVVTPDGGDPGSGSLSGEIDPTGGAFEVIFDRAGDPDILGPFVLRGTNIHFDDTLGALVADLTIQNAGRVVHPEPIGLTFVDLLPPGVTVLNPDNDENGPGAAIVFEFENDDAMWTPGEKSLPRMVQFGVDSAMSIGFVGRLDIGMHPNGGTIGGVVWFDANENGSMDDDEEGIGGAEVFLTEGDHETLTNVEILRRAVTANDGSYRFEGLGPGFYTVFKGQSPIYRPTTPTVIHVFLIEIDGEVSDFLGANFGCVAAPGPPRILLGDFIRATGNLVRLPNDTATNSGLAIKAGVITVFRCGSEPCIRSGVLRGPVLEVNRPKHALRVMSEWVDFAEYDSTFVRRLSVYKLLDPDSVDVDDRVSAEVIDSPNGVVEPLKGISLMEWDEPFEQAAGYVKRIGGNSTRPPTDIIILRNTRIIVTPDTRIEIHGES